MSIQDVTPLNVFAANADKGFWEDKDWEDDRILAMKIALVHTELSEVVEALRDGSILKQSEKIPDYTIAEEECADVVIRVLDFLGGCTYEQLGGEHDSDGGWSYHDADLWGAVLAKLEYNRSRPYRHNKAF